MSESQADVTPEQLIEELQKAKVSDLLVHTCSLLGSLAYGKLADDAKDLEQARLGIDALKALAPLLEEERQKEVQQLVAGLQLAYADASG